MESQIPAIRRLSSPMHESMRRILVTGASGLLGRQVMKELRNAGWEVLGICWTRERPHCVKLDLTDIVAARQQIEDFRPNIVVHCAAERRPDVVQNQPELARKLNVDSTGILAECCTDSGAWFLYISTDYVFDGTNPPYQEDCQPSPVNVYGKQKLEAEEQVKRNSSHAVLRIPVLYGPVEFLEESSVMELYQKLHSNTLKKADHLQKRYPTYACDVAKVILAMANQHQFLPAELSGIFHWQGTEMLTKYDMIKHISTIAGLDMSAVAPDTVLPKAPRPEHSQLACSRLEQLLDDDVNKCRTPFADAMTISLQPYLINHTFQKNWSRKTISREQMLRVIQTLSPDLPREQIDHALTGQEDDAGEIDFEQFIMWIFL